MKKYTLLFLAFLSLCACQTTESSVRHQGRTNYSAIEAVEGEETPVCVGELCSCGSE